MLRVLDLSGFVARNLSGCHIALGGRYETDTSATGDTEDQNQGVIKGSSLDTTLGRMRDVKA